jgi:ribosome maturation factor RimP
MIEINKLKQWVDESISDELFLIDIEWKPGSKKLIVLIDGDKGVSIEQCRQLSRALSEKIDALSDDTGAFVLEVSSPGVDKPLVNPRQFAKHVGRELLIKMHAGTELTGRLEQIDDGKLRLALKDKKKSYKEPTIKEIILEQVKEALVLVSFK